MVLERTDLFVGGEIVEKGGAIWIRIAGRKPVDSIAKARLPVGQRTIRKIANR
jgi:hypothetical protein